jgi:hypothetical protein
MNQLKKSAEIQMERGTGKVARSLMDILNGNFLTSETVVSYLPFIFYLTFIAMVYIGNGYQAENTIRDINRLSNELKELRSEYITTKSELMFRSKQSEVAKSLEIYSIKESVVPPKKLVVAIK